MKNLAYYKGQIGEIDDMKVDYNDRACFFGDGIYEVAYCYNKKIFALQEHIDRFFSAADIIGLNLSINKFDLVSLISQLVNKVEGDRLIVYWQATRGSMDRNHSFDDKVRANLWISVKEGALRDFIHPIKVMLCDDIRHKMCNIKTLNLLPNVMALHKAEKNGCKEVIFHRGERITECAHSNVSIIKDGVLITPPADNLILAGTCRAHLISAARKIGIEVSERKFYIKELLNADEIILTAAGSLAIEVESVDGEMSLNKDRDRLLALRKYLVDEFNEYTGWELR